MSELKRCPFCGGEAKLMDNGHWVWCQHCLVESAYYDTREEAIKAWNTRIPMQNIVERLEEYRDDFMDDIYEELREDADNCRANRIIDRFDEAIEIVKEEGGMNE